MTRGMVFYVIQRDDTGEYADFLYSDSEDPNSWRWVNERSFARLVEELGLPYFFGVGTTRPVQTAQVSLAGGPVSLSIKLAIFDKPTNTRDYGAGLN